MSSAVELYERAANRYAESGLANNAIALCNKILRNAPGRTQVYLKLAKLMVERGFVAEAKQNLLEYADRMQRTGRLDEAFLALRDFADLSPDNDEIRLVLAEQLKAAARTDEARDQLSKLYGELQAAGDTGKRRATVEKMREIDPEYDVEAAPPRRPSSAGGKTTELVFLDLDESGQTAEAPPPPRARPRRPPVEEPEDDALTIETSALAEPDEDAAKGTEDALDTLEVDRSSAEFAPPDDLETQEIEGLNAGAAFDVGGDMLELEPNVLDLEITHGGASLDLEGDAGAASLTPGDELEVIHGGPDASQELAGLGEDDGGAIEVPDLDLAAELEDEEEERAPPPRERRPARPADFPGPEMIGELPPSPPDVATLEVQVADDPDNPDLHRSLGEALIEHGDRTRGLEELDIALNAFESREDWSRAESMAEEILRLDPNSIRHHQKRVEYAFRKGAKGRLIDAYLGLADALFRSGAVDRSRAVYERVLEHDPGNEQARIALETLDAAPAEAPAPMAAPPPRTAAAAPPPKAPKPEPAAPVRQESGAGFVDLGELILEGEPRARDTRMRIEEEEPTGDEQRDFELMLAKFKRGIEANVEDEDWQAHYDLGIAFKEMGLLDEAISEFQKALRSVEGRLKTTEALGRCFYDKGQFSVGGTVLRRAIDSDRGTDEQKIGLLYWLGRCEEEQDRGSQALECYQRVFAVDISFADIRSRVKSLAGAAK